MLKIFPIDKERQSVLCALCNTPYLPDCLAYEATVEDRPVGICQFRVMEGVSTVAALAPLPGIPADKEALFIMCRNALNFIDLCGVHLARYIGDVSVPGEALLHAIGFRNTDGHWEMNLTDFFTSPCKHHKPD